jgi:hypothetical protein
LSHNASAPNFQGISRCRRRLQEAYPELRGKRWRDRQDAQGDMVADLQTPGKWSNVKKC